MKILHIVGAMNLGGQETFIMNVFRKIDKTRFSFDFVVSNSNKGYFDDEIKALGGDIYVIPAIKDNIVIRSIELFKLLKKNKYMVVHRHSAFSIVFIDLLVALLARVKVRIIHSHADYDKHKLHVLFRKPVVLFSNCRLACSEKAANWMYGSKEKRYEVICNGIDINKYAFNNETRNLIRNDLCVEKDTILIGHTGRLTKEKNHRFLFDVFAELKKDNDNICLAVLGDGDQREELEQYCKKLNIEKDVIFCGAKNNVGDYLSAFDCFFFPSLHEGLGISLIEAEINGLLCLVSDKINKEALISDRVISLPLSVDEWVAEYKTISNFEHKELDYSQIKDYDIMTTVRRLEEIYDKEKQN